MPRSPTRRLAGPRPLQSRDGFRLSEPRQDLGLLLGLRRLGRSVGDDPCHGLVDVRARGGLHLRVRLWLRLELLLLLLERQDRLLWPRLVPATPSAGKVALCKWRLGARKGGEEGR